MASSCVVKALGFGDARIHDLRHTYATIALNNGDDVKTLQENLGHANPGFTLKRYGHTLDPMKKSAERMEGFIQNLSSGENEAP